MENLETKAEIEHLFRPINLGTMELKNRIVQLAISNRLLGKAGSITDAWGKFLILEAKGGASLLITPVIPIYNSQDIYYLSMFNDDPVEKLKGFINEAHSYGAKTAAQLLVRFEWEKAPGMPLEFIAPSPVFSKKTGEQTHRELTQEEIQYIVESYGDCAARCKKAGFDSVEVHCGIGFLIAQFLSPVKNKRTDEYSGSLEKRARFALEIIENIQKKAGKDFPIICRISGDDMLDGGNTLKETTQIAKIFEKAGVVALNVQAGSFDSSTPLIQNVVKPAQFAYLAEGIKNAVDIPVIYGYRVNTVQLAEQLLAEGKADMIGMARALIADPELPTKAKEGRLDEIRHCIVCNRCNDLGRYVEPFACSVNPFMATLMEEKDLLPAAEPKIVYIAGSGPAGLQAAWTAAKRGHNVTIWEKRGQLGGALLSACVPPNKDEIADTTKYLISQATKAGVTIKLGQELTVDIVEKDKPDTVIIATGASYSIPPIPGINGANVCTADDVLLGRAEVSGKAVIMGGGAIGCETGLCLAAKGIDVTIVEMLKRIGNNIGAADRWVTIKEMSSAGVKTVAEASVVSIQENGLTYSKEGAEVFVPADKVIIALGLEPNLELANKLSADVKTITIGDALQARQIKEAISEGFKAGQNCG